jgi:tetratricopeptide (TPR) repeat protein
MTNQSLSELLDEFYRDDDNDFFNVELAQRIVAAHPNRAEAHAALARAHYKLEEFDIAALHTRDALQIDPQCPDAIRVHANHLADNEGKTEESHRILDAALKQHPNHYGLLLARGYSAAETGDIVLGVKLLLRACQSRPDYLRALNNLLYFCQEREQWGPMQDAIRKIEAHRPLDGQQLYNIGTALYQSGRYSDAIVFLDRSRDALGEENAIQHNRALCLEKLERYQDAIDEWSTLLLREPDWEWPLEGRMRCHRALNNLEAALADIKRLKAIDPNNKSARGYEASIRYDQKDYATALLLLSDIVADFPDYAWAFNLRGKCHQKLHMTAKARADFLKAIECDDTSFNPQHNVAELEISESRYADALKHAEIAITLQPDDWKARELRAQALSGLNREDDAAKVYSTWLETHPEDVVAANAFGAYLMKHERWQPALSVLERAYDSQQLRAQTASQSYAAWNIGQCHKALGNNPAATEWFQKAKASYALDGDKENAEICEQSIRSLTAKKGFFSKLFG